MISCEQMSFLKSKVDENDFSCFGEVLRNLIIKIWGRTVQNIGGLAEIVKVR